jgi:hypothetical protein
MLLDGVLFLAVRGLGSYKLASRYQQTLIEELIGLRLTLKVDC